jgi:hypothetical protein
MVVHGMHVPVCGDTGGDRGNDGGLEFHGWTCVSTRLQTLHVYKPVIEKKPVFRMMFVFAGRYF